MREVGDAGQLSVDLAEMARRARARKWVGSREHSLLPPAGQVAPSGGVERAEFFSRLRVTMQSGTGDPKKAK